MSASKADRLRLAVRVFRLLEDRDWDDWDDGREVSGTLPDSEENRRLAKELLKLNLLDDGPGTPGGGKVPVTLTLLTLRSEEAYFARTLRAMLEEKIRFRFTGPEVLFVAEPEGGAAAGYLHPDDADAPPEVARYLDTLRLVGQLERVADYVDWQGDEASLFFKLHRTLSLPVVYGSGDLVDLEAPGAPGRLDKLERLLGSPTHGDQIRDILKAALIETLSFTAERFVDVLARFPELLRRFEDNYHLFISEFSFAKVREEVEERRLQHTASLNKVFADIQSKLLAIPVAMVIVAGQMKADGSTFDNFVVLLGAVVFAGLMQLLISNQRNTLESVKGEIDRERGKLAAYPQILPRLVAVYDQLNRRYLHQLRLLGWIELLVMIAVVFPLAVFLYYVYP